MSPILCLANSVKEGSRCVASLDLEVGKLDLYYHLHDDDSMQTMAELAKSSSSENVIQYLKLRAV